MGEGIIISSDNGKHKLILDPHRRVKEKEDVLVSISHAHSDHAREHNAKVLSTPETSCLMPFNADITKKYNEKIEFDGMTIQQENANHILGSSQVVIETKEDRIVYTGDFRLNKSMFGKGKIIDADTIIIESTYGIPKFKFPELEKVQTDLIEWVEKEKSKGNNVLLGAYSLGKAQEITKMLNDYNEIPLVNEKIEVYNEVYNKNGMKLKYTTREKKADVLESPFTSITQNNKILQKAKEMEKETGRKTATALLTGWASLYAFRGVDKTFQLSDHADFYQIIEYIEKARPKKVFTVHGYSKQLAEVIEKIFKIKARQLS